MATRRAEPAGRSAPGNSLAKPGEKTLGAVGDQQVGRGQGAPDGLLTDVVVVGAGVVGLAVAAAASREGLSVLVLERHAGPGKETSSRNSEVLHAGLYYPTGSLKARLCVAGNRALYDFCERHGVEHRRCGKLIVATSPGEIPELERLAALGAANGVDDLELLEPEAARRLEPHVRAEAALLSPSTGIIDSHGLIKALEGITRNQGGETAYRCEVVGITPLDAGGLQVEADTAAGAESIRCRALINCAGLEADHVARLAGGAPPEIHWCKGRYFSLSGRWGSRVNHLIYPAPHPELTTLGIHLTLDLAGRARLGPDAAYLERQDADYDVSASAADLFWRAAQRYLPGLERRDLSPDTSGIRPKLQGPDEPWRDFLVQDEKEAGIPGMINLLGIESPGLTSCLTLAEMAVDTLRQLL